MHPRITGYEPDAEGHWVALLECGHRQHLRHQPPFVERPWVVSEAGRARHLGAELPCVLCERGERKGLMAALENLAPLNGHAIGIIMKELVRRATSAIRNERLVFEAHAKDSHDGTAGDMLTSADLKAQQVYLRSLAECFPTCGLLAEEHDLSVPATPPTSAYFTIDPLDGTKAFIRRQSHGVGTMLALVDRGHVLAAYVGDINTREIYGFRPGAADAYRITDLDTFEPLRAAAPTKPLALRHALLRDPPEAYGAAARHVIARLDGMQIDGGSIGIWTARLWKDEVGAALLPPGWETPWDSSPVIGISRTVGMVFLRPAPHGLEWERFDPVVPTARFRRGHDVLILPASRLGELEALIAS